MNQLENTKRTQMFLLPQTINHYRIPTQVHHQAEHISRDKDPTVSAENLYLSLLVAIRKFFLNILSELPCSITNLIPCLSHQDDKKRNYSFPLKSHLIYFYDIKYFHRYLLDQKISCFKTLSSTWLSSKLHIHCTFITKSTQA